MVFPGSARASLRLHPQGHRISVNILAQIDRASVDARVKHKLVPMVISPAGTGMSSRHRPENFETFSHDAYGHDQRVLELPVLQYTETSASRRRR